jgi:2,4-dienoyl-CoA reductase (NADPH2)
VFEAKGEIGGQFNLARRIPGKEEFAETLRYFRTRMRQLGVRVELNRHVTAENLHGFHHVILATGIVPRVPVIPGIDHPKVASYVEIVEERKHAGRRVAIVGAGGIGFDVGELLTAGAAPDGHASVGREDDPAIVAFRDEWGIDLNFTQRGGLKEVFEHAAPRRLWLLQRKDEKVGGGLAKTTGWIRRALLNRRGVVMYAGVQYDRIDDLGLSITMDGKSELLEVDTIVICAGQEPRRELVAGLEAARIPYQLIGGADVALELDAKRAIEQGTLVAMAL